MDQIIEAVPDSPAPPIPLYPQFVEISVPTGSDALRAYKGFIRPFSDDLNAKLVFRAIEANEQMAVSEGRLHTDAVGLPVHRYEDYLIDMAQPCTVIVLEYAGAQHHRAYLINPLPIKRLSANAHLWFNQALRIDGHLTPALCVYSGNLFTYDPTLDRLVQFLNQVSTYIAKQLIFLRTRMLRRITKEGKLGSFVRIRMPNELVSAGSLSLSNKFLWFGYWPGPIAPNGPSEHVSSVDPEGECWCTSGKLYQACCLPGEKLWLARARGRHTPSTRPSQFQFLATP